ncbi:hypothetical protein LI129_24165, partial [Erysipelatoclostridium ramosum]
GISGGGAVGGFVGDAGTLPNTKFEDVFSISTVFKADPGIKGYSYGGIVGWTAEDWASKGSRYPMDQFINR